MSKKLFNIISRVMEIESSELTDESGPEDVENWDSYNGLLLVDEIESEFNVKFTIEEIFDINSIADIKKHLTNHGIILNE